MSAPAPLAVPGSRLPAAHWTAPSLTLQSELTELVQTYKQEVTEAACELICNWAEKILKRSFDTVVEIARFLVQEHIVNPRCSQAELVTSATLAGRCRSGTLAFS